MSIIETNFENTVCDPLPLGYFPLQNVVNKLKPAGTGWRAAAATALS